jgi:hypothetical protein
MISVVVTAVADDTSSPAPVCQIVAIRSSEPITGKHDQTSPDWEITGPLTASLRAESAHSDRTYTLVVRCADASGNGATASLVIPVSNYRHNPQGAVRPAAHR